MLIASAWNVALVFVGGGLGALARFGIVALFQGRNPASFPAAILTVNIVGCLLVGMVGVSLLGTSTTAQSREAWRFFVIIGFLGAFTTFSAFSWETLEMLNARRYGAASLYVLLSNALCLGAAAAGFQIGQKFLPH